MKGYKHLTREQQEQLLTVYRRTLSVQATAEQVGASRGQVRHHLKKAGIAPSREKGGACYRRLEDVRRWAKEGMAVSEIGRRIGTTSSKVSAFLKKHGIERTPFRQAMENNPAWRGGRVIDPDGYVLVKAPDHPYKDRHGYVREHRLVMEATLGRCLTREETVHHKDGDKENNSSDNLQLFASNGDHLAETLAGKVPQWTEEGRARILAAVRNQAPRIVSQETRKKLSEASRRRRGLTPEGRERLRESGRLVQSRRRAASRQASAADDHA